MIAIILAAGKGTRLSEYYSCSSKCMIPFEGKPLIERTLNHLSRCVGLKRIYIVIRKDEKEIPSYIGREYLGIPITYCEQDEEKPGIMNAVYSVPDLLELKNEDVIINLGDEYYNNIDYNSLIKKHKCKRSSVTPIVIYCKDKEEVKKNYTVNITNTDEIIDAIEKPSRVFNNYIGTGILLVSVELLKDFALYYNNNFYEKQLVDWMKFSIQTKRQCYVQKVDTDFCNLNYQRDLEHLYTVNYNENMNTICNMFSKVVELYPNKKAITFEGKSITFKDLDDKSDSIAYNIQKKNFIHGDCAAIMSTDPIECIIYIIGVLKSGGYYVILDNKYSKEMITDIIEKAHIKILIKDNGFIQETEMKRQQNRNFYNKGDSCEKVVILFNDESKKLNILSMKSIINLVLSMKESIFDNCKKDCLEIGMTSELSMNSSVPFLYATLLNGYTLNIISKKGNVDIQRFITDLNNVDICDIDPSTIYLISGYIKVNPGTKLYTKILVSSGENLKKEAIHNFFQQCPLTTVINVYGMVECTIQSAMFYINKENEERLEKIPIGKPIRNTRIYILDSNKKIVGVKCIGDIWIAGDGVQLGEFEDEKLSKTSFCKDIINDERKMFNTGDKGYIGLDGNIYLG